MLSPCCAALCRHLKPLFGGSSAVCTVQHGISTYQIIRLLTTVLTGDQNVTLSRDSSTSLQTSKATAAL